MLEILKVLLLFISILVVLPIVFFLLIAFLGNGFSLSIDERSWLARLRR